MTDPQPPPLPPLPNLAPSGSTNASVAGGAVAVLVVYALSMKGIFLPAGVEAALAALMTAIAGYLPKSGRRG